MDAGLTARLLRLNREFYARFASEFSETRSAQRLNLNAITPYLFDGARVLDIGCGNGRLAERLDRAEFRLSYLGVDVTPELIAIANARRPRRGRIAAEFHVADVTSPGWSDCLPTPAPFDFALALAVLHHIPSFELRREVLRSLYSLLRAGGTLVLSNWQFTRSARLRSKIVPWQTLGIDEGAVEPGDALLDWKRGGTGCRYVHLLTGQELQALAAQSGFHVVEQSYADAELNLFSILRT